MAKIEYGVLSEDGSILKARDLFSVPGIRSRRRRVWHKVVNGHWVETRFLGTATAYPPEWNLPADGWFETRVASPRPTGLFSNAWRVQRSDRLEEAAAQYQAAVRFAEKLPPTKESVPPR